MWCSDNICTCMSSSNLVLLTAYVHVCVYGICMQLCAMQFCLLLQYKVQVAEFYKGQRGTYEVDRSGSSVDPLQVMSSTHGHVHLCC